MIDLSWDCFSHQRCVLTNITYLENKVYNALVKRYLFLSVLKANICFMIVAYNFIFIFLRKLGFVSWEILVNLSHMLPQNKLEYNSLAFSLSVANFFPINLLTWICVTTILSFLFISILEYFIICTKIFIPVIFKNIHTAEEIRIIFTKPYNFLENSIALGIMKTLLFFIQLKHLISKRSS